MPSYMKSAYAQASYRGRVQDLAEDHPDGKHALPTAPVLVHPARVLCTSLPNEYAKTDPHQASGAEEGCGLSNQWIRDEAVARLEEMGRGETHDISERLRQVGGGNAQRGHRSPSVSMRDSVGAGWRDVALLVFPLDEHQECRLRRGLRCSSIPLPVRLLTVSK